MTPVLTTLEGDLSGEETPEPPAAQVTRDMMQTVTAYIQGLHIRGCKTS